MQVTTVTQTARQTDSLRLTSMGVVGAGCLLLMWEGMRERQASSSAGRGRGWVARRPLMAETYDSRQAMRERT